MPMPDQRGWPVTLEGTYTPVSVLGCGGRSVVFKAVETATNRIYAIKVPQVKNAGEALNKLHKILRLESNMLATARGKGVVRLIDADADGHYLILEELSGVTVHCHYRTRRPKMKTALRIVSDVAKTLGRIHRRGILHLDVKPRNLVYARDRSTVVLTDFGSARPAKKRVTNRTLAPKKLGSGMYLFNAPEQLMSLSKKYTSQTDAFALGCTLWWLLYGAAPFSNRSTNPEEALRTYQLELAQAVARCKSSQRLPELSNILEKLLQIDANDRPHDLCEIGEQLEHVLQRPDLG